MAVVIASKGKSQVVGRGESNVWLVEHVVSVQDADLHPNKTPSALLLIPI
ncbi:MAG: hypothetical protein JRJ79_12155 [Deltaproteobacteria bacterium]|nr:hypothetical protein [Deltaproteobacteria bacterium]